MARAGKGSSKAERDALRQEMLVSGCSLELIATEMERRWGIRPREAYRHAHGWSQDEVAARFTEVADRTGGDRNLGSDGRPLPAQAPMIGTRIGEYERWPHGGRRPSPYVLTVLATVLGTTVERLLDYDDHRKMPDQERTVLAAVLAAANAPVALPPEPRTAPGPSSRAPLGRLTELLTSSDPATGQPGSATGAEGTEKDRAGRAGALTAEQWSAARRLVERGFGLTEDGVADPEADAGNVSGASAAPTARGGKTRSPARRPRAGTPRRTERAAGRGAQPDETDQTGPAAKTGSAAPAVHAGPAALTGPTTPTETGALSGQAVPTEARAQTEPAVPTDTSGRTGSAAQTGRAEKPGPAAAADPTAKVWPGAPAGSDVDEHPEAAAGPDVAGLLVPDAGPQVGAEARRAEYVDALDRLGATDLPGALRRSAAAAAGTEGEPSDAAAEGGVASEEVGTSGAAADDGFRTRAAPDGAATQVRSRGAAAETSRSATQPAGDEVAAQVGDSGPAAEDDRDRPSAPIAADAAATLVGTSGAAAQAGTDRPAARAPARSAGPETAKSATTTESSRPAAAAIDGTDGTQDAGETAAAQDGPLSAADLVDGAAVDAGRGGAAPDAGAADGAAVDLENGTAADVENGAAVDVEDRATSGLGPASGAAAKISGGSTAAAGAGDAGADVAGIAADVRAAGRGTSARGREPTPLGRRGPDVRGGAVILPFPEEPDARPDEPDARPDEPDGRSAEPDEPQPVRSSPVPDARGRDDAKRHDDPPDQPGWDAYPGGSYGPARLQQRVPRPVPPPLPDPPYIAVTLDPTSPDAAAAARRHRRDRLLATELNGTGIRSDEEVIMDAAGQSAEFSEWAEATNVGSTTLEQLDEDVRRISRDYLGNPPLPLLLGALRVRNRVFTLLEGRQHPQQSRHLYLTAGRLCGLLGWMASDLGRHGEAETQARTAWLCAELAGSDGLRAWVRATQSKIAYWDGRVQESAGLAADGLRFAAPDSARVLLASLSARAWARLGRTDEAHSALHAAEDERARAGEDEVGGLLGFSEAQQSYMAGSTYLWLREPKEALAASDRAIWLFDVGSASNRFYGAEMLALVDAASALVQSGDLDGAAERLRPVLELPPEQQLDTFTSRLGELRDSLRRSRYATSKPAVDIQRQIEEFRAGALGQILGR